MARSVKKYPLDVLEVGDHFDANGPRATSTDCTALNHARRYGYRTGKVFRGRKIKKGTVRIWRVA